MDAEGLQVLLLAWLTLVGLAIVAEVVRGRLTGPAAFAATWLVMAGLTVALGGVVAFIGCHVLLFAFGTQAAAAGMAASAVVLTASPFAWALALWRRSRPAHPIPQGLGRLHPPTAR